MEKLQVTGIKKCWYDTESSTYIVEKLDGQKGAIDAFLDEITYQDGSGMQITFGVIEELGDEEPS